MADPYVGEIRTVGFIFAPVGWLSCQGQLLSIQQYSDLYAIINTTYGGDGVSTFALPDLSSRAPVHVGISPSTQTKYALGQRGGQETVTLTTSQIPAHVHPIAAQAANAVSSSPSGAVLGSGFEYLPTPGTSATGPLLSAAGSDQSHSNQMPYLAINYIIAYEGQHPSHS